MHQRYPTAAITLVAIDRSGWSRSIVASGRDRRSGERVGSFVPFQTTYYLNGHSFIEHQLKAANVDFRKHDNAFLAVGDVAALQAAADKLSPEIIRKQLDYWTFLLGPKFSAKE